MESTEYSFERRGDYYVAKKQSGGRVWYLHDPYGPVLLDGPFDVDLFVTGRSLLTAEYWAEQDTVLQAGQKTCSNMFLAR